MSELDYLIKMYEMMANKQDSIRSHAVQALSAETRDRESLAQKEGSWEGRSCQGFGRHVGTDNLHA